MVSWSKSCQKLIQLEFGKLLIKDHSPNVKENNIPTQYGPQEPDVAQYNMIATRVQDLNKKKKELAYGQYSFINSENSRLFFFFFPTPLKTESLNDRGAAANVYIYIL